MTKEERKEKYEENGRKQLKENRFPPAKATNE